MKFLCVPCDVPMKLQTVAPPERGSLSVVYACPECGYEMAMLTNAYETQVVQSLGVRIGPAVAGESSQASGSGCPFTAMIQPTASERSGDLTAANERERVSHANGAGLGAPSESVGRSWGAKSPSLTWTAAAEARLANIPEFVRPMARTGIERFALERGAAEVDETVLDAARDFFGM
jgi:hypothetical protein